MIDITVFLSKPLPKRTSQHEIVIHDNRRVTLDGFVIGRVSGTSYTDYYLLLHGNHSFLWEEIKNRLDKDEIISMFNPTCYECCSCPEFETVEQLEEFLNYIADVLYDVLKYNDLI